MPLLSMSGLGLPSALNKQSKIGAEQRGCGLETQQQQWRLDALGLRAGLTPFALC